jgi:EF-P beta-lysylation protein EpmB
LESEPWQQALAAAISDPRELLQLLGLEESSLPLPVDHDPDFPLRVPRYYAGLMRHGDPADPLLAQVLPTRRERDPVTGFVTDPVDDLAAVQNPGMLKKYHGRALMITTGACAVHCRYCFRRHYPYAGQSATRSWQAALDGLRRTPEVGELILSGGDPLALSDRRLAALVSEAAAIPHLQRLRIHTRLPVVLPSRITPQLVDLIGASRLRSVVVIHVNHPHEVTRTLGEALWPLAAAGVQLLNQAVLLKSVNDDADTLVKLSESLFDRGVLPYYLHLLDPVAGAAHFSVSTERARAIERALWERLPGFLVPRVVREMPGAAGKSPLSQL